MATIRGARHSAPIPPVTRNAYLSRADGGLVIKPWVEGLGINHRSRVQRYNLLDPEYKTMLIFRPPWLEAVECGR